MVPSVPGNDKRLISSPPLIGVFYTGTFILTGESVTGGFNRSTVVVVQGAVRVLPKGTFSRIIILLLSKIKMNFFDAAVILKYG